MSVINFFTEDINFELTESTVYSNWIQVVIADHDYQLEEINYIFCSDTYLHQVNVEYLNHDTYTDIITFDNSEDEGVIESDIFISIDRIKENAVEMKVSFEQELQRVIIHGVLHLLGFKDKSEEEAGEMRNQENKSMAKFEQFLKAE